MLEGYINGTFASNKPKSNLTMNRQTDKEADRPIKKRTDQYRSE